MQKTFSPQVIARAQRIFKQRSGRFISADEAMLYLEQLAKIGDLAMRVMKQEVHKKEKIQSMRGP